MTVSRIDQSDQRSSEGTLSASGLSDDTEGLSLEDIKRDIVDSANRAGFLIFSFEIYFDVIGPDKYVFGIFMLFSHCQNLLSFRSNCRSASNAPFDFHQRRTPEVLPAYSAPSRMGISARNCSL